MIFQHTHEAVLDGRKTQTRRAVQDGHEAIVDGGVIVGIRNRTTKRWIYRVGHEYSVQPGRRSAGIGRIRITAIRHAYKAGAISGPDSAAEGFASTAQFRRVYSGMHGVGALEKPCWVIEFNVLDS